MIGNENQDPKGYYYAPTEEGGKYQSMLSQAGMEGGRLLVGVISMYRGAGGEMAANSAMGMLGSVVGSIGSSILGEVGQTIDNLPNTVRNFETMLEQLNDPASWMRPDGS